MMKFFLTKQAWQNEVDSIKTPLINEKEQLMKFVEAVYNIDLHNKNADELIIALSQNKNALIWNNYEQGHDAGVEVVLQALLHNKIIDKAMAADLTKATKKYAHEIITKTKEDMDEQIINRWRKE